MNPIITPIWDSMEVYTATDTIVRATSHTNRVLETTMGCLHDLDRIIYYVPSSKDTIIPLWLYG